MDIYIDNEFLENNCFEKEKIGCGYYPWNYYGKRYSVEIATWTDRGYAYISVKNHENRESITFEKRVGKLTQDDLHRLILFIGVPDEFEYGV